MKIRSWEEEKEGGVVYTTQGKIRFQVYTPHIIRITYTKALDFSKEESLIVEAKPDKYSRSILMEEGECLIFQTDEVRIEINKTTGALAYFNKNQDLLIREPIYGGKQLEKVEVIKTIFDAHEKTKQIKSIDGVKVEANEGRRVVDHFAYRGKLEFEWAEDEAIYGFGSHEEGIFNYRGHSQYLYQQNMKAVVPMFVSTKGYGVLIDTYGMMTFRDDHYGSYISIDADSELDFYFIYGPELDQVIAGYRTLTGVAPMLPKWAFGYVQSKERYKTQEELIETVAEYRRRNIPLDLIVLDWQSWEGDLWGEKCFDKKRFPQPEKMMELLHKEHAKLMVSIWPNMAEGGTNHKQMLEAGYLLGNQSTYNAFDLEAREMYWKQVEEGLFEYGLDAWWCDCTEPFEADWKGEIKPNPEERARINTDEAKKYMDPEYINAFSLMHSKGIYEGQRRSNHHKRVVNLTRSAYAGQHRYSTITWSGDISASWKTLQHQISEGLNFCATGEPYWTQDIGGFFVGGKNTWSQWRTDVDSPEIWFLEGEYGDLGCKDLGYRELYLRWFQYATFSPMLRAHGTDYPREVWQFGEPGDIFYDTLVKFIELRYRLLPYIYSIAAQVTHQAGTMLRLLAFDFRNDQEVYNIGDEYMFGPHLLVCPVTKPMYYEANSKPIKQSDKKREVYLPKGTKWYDFWDEVSYDGGQMIEARADLGHIPLFVKAGAILPMGPVIQYVDEQLDGAIELRIYSGADGQFTLYEDEGDNYNYEQGQFATIDISWNEASKVLRLAERKGSFEGMCRSRTYEIKLIGGESVIKKTIVYDGEVQSLLMTR